jgi:hypothetical protein
MASLSFSPSWMRASSSSASCPLVTLLCMEGQSLSWQQRNTVHLFVNTLLLLLSLFARRWQHPKCCTQRRQEEGKRCRWKHVRRKSNYISLTEAAAAMADTMWRWDGVWEC